MKEVYLNEYNIPQPSMYLPIVSGKLVSKAWSYTPIACNCKFKIIFQRDKPNNILKQYDNPDVAAFSSYMWNINLNLAVAAKIKQEWPGCLVVFGGPHVNRRYIRKYPFIDKVIEGEGEQPFSMLLLERLNERLNGRLDERMPSPYLKGIFDLIIKDHRDIKFQAILETNRGCPFRCSYCYWGQNKHKLYSFDFEQIKQEITWCGQNKIEYVFCADANFGMFKRDLEIAQHLVETKQEYGYPKKFRACYGKNAEKTIYEIGKLLTKHDMEKGITLSKQTNSDSVQKNINRKNINQEMYDSLLKKYDKNRISTYTELILGLPGETLTSWVQGIEKIIKQNYEFNQIIIYPLQVYPNSELADLVYQQKHGIQTITIPLLSTHALESPDNVIEHETIVISTDTMSKEDWRTGLVYSWIIGLFHGLKLGREFTRIKDFTYFSFMNHLLRADSPIVKEMMDTFNKTAQRIFKGDPYKFKFLDFGEIIWELDEAMFLYIMTRKESFYKELQKILNNKKIIEKQKNLLPDIEDYPDYPTFAREIVLYGRKTGKIYKQSK